HWFYSSVRECNFRSVTLTACEGFRVLRMFRDGDGITCWTQVLLDLRFLCDGEPMALKNVVGESVEEPGGADLFNAAHDQLPQIPVSPAGMNAFADRAGFVLRLARFASHPGSP